MAIQLDETHDAQRKSWIASANGHGVFPIQNLPLCVFRVPGQREAWREIRYGQLVQVFMEASKPFWEQDGMSPELWSDGPIERVLRLPSQDGAQNNFVAFINGEATVCYDGQYFFDTDHVEGDSGTQSNDLSVDISALACSVHGTTTAPSVEDLASPKAEYRKVAKVAYVDP